MLSYDHPAREKTRRLQAECDDLLLYDLALRQDLAEAKRAEEKAEKLAERERLKARLSRAECAYLRHKESGKTKLAERAKRKMYALMGDLGMEY